MENKSNKNPIDVIKAARIAFEEKDYPEALEKYKWFFENAIKINKTYVGVRLSFCLDGWASLAKVYSPAMDSLTEQKNIALNNFNETSDTSSFKDYATICEYLNCPEEAVMLFKNAHSENRELSKKIFRSVNDPLFRNKEWNICREYLGNCTKKYEGLIELFDHMIKAITDRLGEEGNDIVKDSIAKTKEECLCLLNINFHANDKNGYIMLLEKMQADFEHRGYYDLYNEILNDAPKWSE